MMKLHAKVRRASWGLIGLSLAAAGCRGGGRGASDGTTMGTSATAGGTATAGDALCADGIVEPGQMCFGPTFLRKIPQYSVWPTVADLDEDGIVDLVTAINNVSSQAPPNAVYFFRGVGDGTFEAEVISEANVQQPISRVVVRFHSDGRPPDVILGGALAVEVMEGVGDGTFTPGDIYRQGDYGYGAVIGGDFNGDGRLDLAGAALADMLRDMRLLLGQPDGTFVDGGNVVLGDLQDETSLLRAAAADLNGDGIDDLLKPDPSLALPRFVGQLR